MKRGGRNGARIAAAGQGHRQFKFRAQDLRTVDIPVDLPASSVERQKRPDKPLYLTVKSDLTVALNEDTVARDRLGAALDAFTKGDRETRVFLRTDKAVPYGDMMEVMERLREAGYLKVALVSLEKASKR